MQKDNLEKKEFGRWKVIRFYKIINHKTFWWCKCKCGTEKAIDAHSLKSGTSKSCGCYNKEIASATMKTHGMSKSKLYYVYKSMINRCYNSKVKGYYNYGGRGITVCNEWKNDFVSFYNWSVANGYAEKMQIDRIEVNGNYEPSNCRWVTNKVNCLNKRDTIFVEYNNKKITIEELAIELKKDVKLIYSWYESGNLERYIKENHEIPYKYLVNGKYYTLKELSKTTGINQRTIRGRRDAGKRGLDLITPKRK